MLKYTEEQFGNKLFRISRNFTVFTKFYFNREKSLAQIMYNAMNKKKQFFNKQKSFVENFSILFSPDLVQFRRIGFFLF